MPISWGCEVEPASCYWRVAGRFPWCAWQSVLGLDTEPQTAPDVLVSTLMAATTIRVCMYELL